MFPFTGVWRASATGTSLYLYQQDAERVFGSWNDATASGLVRTDGRLDLAVTGRQTPTIMTLVLHGDSLAVERGLTENGEVIPGPLVRQ